MLDGELAPTPGFFFWWPSLLFHIPWGPLGDTQGSVTSKSPGMFMKITSISTQLLETAVTQEPILSLLGFL